MKPIIVSARSPLPAAQQDSQLGFIVSYSTDRSLCVLTAARQRVSPIQEISKLCVVRRRPNHCRAEPRVRKLQDQGNNGDLLLNAVLELTWFYGSLHQRLLQFGQLRAFVAEI